MRWTTHPCRRRHSLRCLNHRNSCSAGESPVRATATRNYERQLLHAVSERLRTERRTTFVDYLSAYSDLREKINASAGNRPIETATHCPTRARGAKRARRASRVDEYAAEEAARFSRAYHTLRITGNDAVGEAATAAHPTCGYSPISPLSVTGASSRRVGRPRNAHGAPARSHACRTRRRRTALTAEIAPLALRSRRHRHRHLEAVHTFPAQRGRAVHHWQRPKLLAWRCRQRHERQLRAGQRGAHLGGIHAEGPHPEIPVGDRDDGVTIVHILRDRIDRAALFNPTCPTTRPLHNCSIAFAIPHSSLEQEERAGPG